MRNYGFIENKFYVLIRGPRACFANPLLKVERMSYDYIPPGVAEEILGCVYDHPEIKWQVNEIRVINPIGFSSFMTNEIKGFSTPSVEDIKNAIEGKKTIETINVNDMRNRMQRNNLILKDVCYIVEATITRALDCPHEVKDFNIKKYLEIFMNRMEREEFFKIPFLGQREYIAELELIKKEDLNKYTPINKTSNYGLLLHHVDYISHKTYFYNATMVNGVVNCRFEEVGVND